MYGQHIHRNNVCRSCNWPLNLIDVALHWISRVSKVDVDMFLAIACKPNSTLCKSCIYDFMDWLQQGQCLGTNKNPYCFNCEQNKQGLEPWLVKHDCLIPILYPCFDRLRISIVHFCLYGAWRYMLMFIQAKCYFLN